MECLAGWCQQNGQCCQGTRPHQLHGRKACCLLQSPDVASQAEHESCEKCTLSSALWERRFICWCEMRPAIQEFSDAKGGKNVILTAVPGVTQPPTHPACCCTGFDRNIIVMTKQHSRATGSQYKHAANTHDDDSTGCSMSNHPLAIQQPVLWDWGQQGSDSDAMRHGQLETTNNGRLPGEQLPAELY